MAHPFSPPLLLSHFSLSFPPPLHLSLLSPLSPLSNLSAGNCMLCNIANVHGQLWCLPTYSIKKASKLRLHPQWSYYGRIPITSSSHTTTTPEYNVRAVNRFSAAVNKYYSPNNNPPNAARRVLTASDGSFLRNREQVQTTRHEGRSRKIKFGIANVNALQVTGSRVLLDSFKSTSQRNLELKLLKWRMTNDEWLVEWRYYDFVLVSFL